jgi:hypothetical protein
MKKVFLRSMAMAAIAVMFASCDKTDDVEQIEENIDPVVASISRKWDIKAAGSRYASFEFQTDGTYVVSEYITARSANRTLQIKASSLQDVRLKPNPFLRIAEAGSVRTRAADNRVLTAHVGHYTISGNVIVLTDLGMIEQFTVDADEFRFTFKPDGAVQAIEYVGVKADEIAASNRTTRLCRMWQIESIKVNMKGMSNEMKLLLESLGGTAMFDAMLEEMVRFELDGRTVTLCAMLSKAGTYLSLFRDEDGNYFTEIADGWLVMSTVIGQWRWLDAKETKIEWKQTGSYGMDGGEGIADVTELSLTSLTLEGSTDEGTLEGYGMGYVEKFKAVNKL